MSEPVTAKMISEAWENCGDPARLRKFVRVTIPLNQRAIATWKPTEMVPPESTYAAEYWLEYRTEYLTTGDVRDFWRIMGQSGNLKVEVASGVGKP